MRRIDTASMPSVSATRIAADASSARPRRALARARLGARPEVERVEVRGDASERGRRARARRLQRRVGRLRAWRSRPRSSRRSSPARPRASLSAAASFACVFDVGRRELRLRLRRRRPRSCGRPCSAIRSIGSRPRPERDEELLAMSYSVLLRSRTMYETTSPRPDAVPPAPAGGGVTTTGLGKRFGDLWALRDLRSRRRARHRARPPRPQRRRQDDRDPHPHHPEPPHRGLGHRRRASTSPRTPNASASRSASRRRQATVDDLMTRPRSTS